MIKKPEIQRQVISQILIRRTLAARATGESLDQDPVTAARLQLIRERVLTEAYLQKKAREALDASDVEGLAQTEYRANPERFVRNEEVRVRHLLIARNNCDADAGKSKAEVLRTRLLAGESFEALAKEFSADQASGENGGDLGFVPRGKTVKEFEDAAFALSKPGDISEVVETKFGFHIIELEERRSAGTVPYDEVRDRLIGELSAKLREGVRTRLVNAVKDEAAMEFDEVELNRFLTQLRDKAP